MSMLDLTKDHYDIKHVDMGQVHIKLTPKGRNHLRDHLSKDHVIVGLAIPAWNFYGPAQDNPMTK